MGLNRFTITQKVFAVVVVFALALVLLGATSWNVANVLDDQIADVDADGKAVVLVARMNTNIQAMNALQYQLLADPTPATRDVVAKGLARERDLFESRTEELTRRLDAAIDPAALTTVRSGFAGYVQSLDRVLAAVEAQDHDALIAANGKTSKQAADLREAVRAFFKLAETHANEELVASNATVKLGREIIVAVTVIAVALGSLLAWVIVRVGISRPLSGSVTALSAMADGSLDVDIPGADRADEIGTVARAMQVFKEKLLVERRLEQEAEARSHADLERARAIAALTQAFDSEVRQVLGTVGGEVGQLEENSTTMSTAARDASERAEAAAAAAVQAAGNVQTVAAAAEELAASIDEIGRQVEHANAISCHASERAADINTLVQSLAETASRIGAVVETITAIASQTNLLALNATIEAARAGEAGKGFAVVANEVKALATQTSRATDDVATQVGEVRERVSKAVTAINQIVGIIGEVSQASAGIASAVEEQAAATAEIARNVEQAAIGTDQVSSNMVGVQQAAETTGTAANSVLNIAHGVAGDAQALRGLVERFLASMRSA
ncbi:MAG: methyl-accepting chemotaxis protein [Bacteroidota bacterium]